jgi:hypothetical protein
VFHGLPHAQVRAQRQNRQKLCQPYASGRRQRGIRHNPSLSPSAGSPQGTRAALKATAVAALQNGDIGGACAAAYDAYRMAAEALLARQGLRATAGDGSHMSVEVAVSARFAATIGVFAKPIFERFRRNGSANQCRARA